MAVLLVGLTGGIGSGKSTVAALLAERGAIVLDADALAREVVEPGRPAFHAVVERFGSEVLTEEGTLDRAALAGVVFRDERARKDLEAITHPAIGAAFTERVRSFPDHAIVVMDVPLLVEADRRSYDVTVVVEAPRETRLDRLEQRGLSRADAEARMANQASDEQRRAVADLLIDNGGDQAALRREVDRVWAALEERAASKRVSGEQPPPERSQGPSTMG